MGKKVVDDEALEAIETEVEEELSDDVTELWELVS
jgi:hypothetical protein